MSKMTRAGALFLHLTLAVPAFALSFLVLFVPLTYSHVDIERWGLFLAALLALALLAALFLVRGGPAMLAFALHVVSVLFLTYRFTGISQALG